MAEPPSYRSRDLAVPESRIARMARLGALTGGVLGSVALDGGRAWARGERPGWQDLVLTPGNVSRLTHQLAAMRGAAMKLGQLLSMEAGEFIDPQLAEILAHLRADAHTMPGKQLKSVLAANWGAVFLRRFRKFDVTPIAAASIGQVHRAVTRDGRDLAIKVQYPGVRASIDSDLRNVAGLLRVSGLLPRGLDIAPMIEEARRQLHEEADYRREGREMEAFARLLDADQAFAVPVLHADLTTSDILAMDFLPGDPIETLAHAPQELRDRVVERLVALVLRELFEFHRMQTDPNFANYRYQPESGRIVLLDFGATRSFSHAFSDRFRALLRAGVAQDRAAIRDCALRIGYFSQATPEAQQAQLLDMMQMALAPLGMPGAFDFAASPLPAQLREAGLAYGAEADFQHIPPVDTLFLQRKIGGLYLLGARLRARLDVSRLIAPWL